MEKPRPNSNRRTKESCDVDTSDDVQIVPNPHHYSRPLMTHSMRLNRDRTSMRHDESSGSARPILPSFIAPPEIKDVRDQIKALKNENDKSFFQRALDILDSRDHKEDRGKHIHELLVQLQTEQHVQHDSLFNLVIQGDLAGIQEKLLSLRKSGSHEDVQLVLQPDAAGGNAIHAAYLYQKYEIGRWFVENYPQIAVNPYSDECPVAIRNIDSTDMPYTGENILHMTIVRKNIVETRWLLDFYKDHEHSVKDGLETLLLGNATGIFFSRKGDFYCGSYPLHFAACSNNTDMFDLILAYASVLRPTAGASIANNSSARTLRMHRRLLHERFGSNAIFMRDQHGNNCLHLAVIHGHTKMYTHIKETAVNALKREIRLAYAEKLMYSTGNELKIFLEPVPNHPGFTKGYCPKQKDIYAPLDRLSAEAFNVWLTEATEKKFQERMELVLNEDFHSPLTIAVDNRRVGNKYQKCGENLQQSKIKEMLSFLIKQVKKDRWDYGPMKCSLLTLEGVEFPHVADNYPTLPPSAVEKMHGVVEWICITDSTGCATIPEIQKIITAKWQRFGYSIFLKQFIFRSALTALLTLLLCFANSTPSYSGNQGAIAVGNKQVQTTVSILYPIALFLIICMGAYEIPCIVDNGIYYWGMGSEQSKRRIRGAAKFEKIANTILIVSFTCVVVNQYIRHIAYKQGHSSTPTADLGVKISYTACIIVAWLYLFYFLMGFDKTGPFVLTVYRIVSRDIPFFVTFYIIVVIAFGCALSLLTNSGNATVAYGFSHLFLTIFDLIQITVSMQQPGSYNIAVNIDTVSQVLVWFFEIVFTVFYIVVVLMFLNLLIAMINNTYSKLINVEDALLLIEKYNIMCAMESSLWLLDRKTLPESYSVVVRGNIGDVRLESADESNGQFYQSRPVPIEDISRSTMYGTVATDANKAEEQCNDTDRSYAFEMLTEDSTWWGSVQRKPKAISSAIIRKKVTMLLIMPQNDFHEADGVEGTPSYRPAGSLAVPGSTADSRRIGDLILRNIDKIDDIIVTLDSHYPTHIAHSIFWKKGPSNPDATKSNIHPENFTVISHSDIVDGIWMPVQTNHLDWVKYYTKELEKKSKLKLTIWPQHCLIGSTGHAIVAPINVALQQWATVRHKDVQYFRKGENLLTEMYSALGAEVEDPSDPKTAMDWDLLADLKLADKILICGQALSHCVNFTVMDILKHWHSDPAKLHLICDGCSSVKGFEDVGRRFLEDIKKLKVTVLECKSVAL